MSDIPSGVTPKGRQYRVVEEERDQAQIKSDERTQTVWRMEALQHSEDGPEWVTVGFCLPMGVQGRVLDLSIGPAIDMRIDDRNNEHRLTFTGLWLPPEVE